MTIPYYTITREFRPQQRCWKIRTYMVASERVLPAHIFKHVQQMGSFPGKHNKHLWLTTCHSFLFLCVLGENGAGEFVVRWFHHTARHQDDKKYKKIYFMCCPWHPNTCWHKVFRDVWGMIQVRVKVMPKSCLLLFPNVTAVRKSHA